MLIVIRMENSFSNRFFDDLGQLRRKYVNEIFIGIGDLNRGIISTENSIVARYDDM